ncbi:unnamed protein product [Phaeothamnion confervicola]
MDLGDGADLRAFGELLREADEHPENRSAQSVVKCTPTVFKHPASQAAVAGPPKVSTSIWDEDDIHSKDAIEFADDGRPAPLYDILYKQNVMSEDVFLGIGDKTPGSKDCTHMVVKIQFPGARMADLELDVTRHKIRAESPDLRLATYLPLPVDESKGVAKWDPKRCTLAVTLPIFQTDS